VTGKLTVTKKVRTGVPLRNNTWHSLNSSDTVFVFVHGFFSNSDACWTSKNGVRWPDLIVSDERLLEPSVFMSGYYTAIDSGNYKISDCAREVLEGLQSHGIDGEPAPLSKSKIVFVCHSLGGIVARYMIERNREVFLGKTVALLLIASPSYGSELANTFRGVIQLFGNKLAQQLAAANDSLDDLDDRFKDLVNRKSSLNIIGAEAIEQHFPLHWKLIPALRPIVSKDSAARYFGASKLLQNTDHSTCVKPTNHEHVSHIFLVNQLREFIREDAGVQSSTQYVDVSKTSRASRNFDLEISRAKIPRGRAQVAPELFEVYAPEYEPYYISRDIDKDISNIFSMLSLWVHGESGLGKTAAIRREVSVSSTNTVQVYIGSTGDTTGGHIALLREIYYTLAGKFGCDYKDLSTANQVISEVAILLAEASKELPVCLVVDEVPVITSDAEEVGHFILSIHRLILTLKQQFGVLGIRVVISSIFDPEQYRPNGSERVFEQMKFLAFERWKPAEISKLIDVICAGLPSVSFDTNERNEVRDAAAGSPRFVKTFFKNFSVSPRTIDEVIRETRISMGYCNDDKEKVR